MKSLFKWMGRAAVASVASVIVIGLSSAPAVAGEMSSTKSDDIISPTRPRPEMFQIINILTAPDLGERRASPHTPPGQPPDRPPVPPGHGGSPPGQPPDRPPGHANDDKDKDKEKDKD